MGLVPQVCVFDEPDGSNASYLHSSSVLSPSQSAGVKGRFGASQPNFAFKEALHEEVCPLSLHICSSDDEEASLSDDEEASQTSDEEDQVECHILFFMMNVNFS